MRENEALLPSFVPCPSLSDLRPLWRGEPMKVSVAVSRLLCSLPPLKSGPLSPSVTSHNLLFTHFLRTNRRAASVAFYFRLGLARDARET